MCVRLTVRRHATKVDDNFKLILSRLLEADGPLTHRELTQKVMAYRELLGRDVLASRTGPRDA